MALKPENPVVGGTVLRRAAIQSPNYAPGVSGWTIKQDGSAEFNNLTIRGTFNGTDFIINSSGAFFYSGTPALGNLIVAIASLAGTDQFGNVYPQGVQIGPSGSQAQIKLIPGMSGAASQVQFPLPGVTLSNTPNIAGGLGGGTNPELLMSGPAVTGAGQTDWTQIAMFANPGGGGQASTQFVYVNSSGTAVLIADYNGSGWVFTNAAPVTVQGNLSVGGTLTVTGTASINGSTSVGFPNPNATSTNGLANGQIAGTSGGASAGTAHTHGAGSYAVTSGQHSHDLQNHGHPL